MGGELVKAREKRRRRQLRLARRQEWIAKFCAFVEKYGLLSEWRDEEAEAGRSL